MKDRHSEMACQIANKVSRNKTPQELIEKLSAIKKDFSIRKKISRISSETFLKLLINLYEKKIINIH